MSDETYPGIRLGETMVERFVPYARINKQYMRSGSGYHDTEEGAWAWLIPGSEDVVVRETVTTVREVIRYVPPVDIENERAG